MHPFKKMIYMLRHDTTIDSLEANSYYVKVGSQTCVGGYVNIGSFSYQTLYSNTMPIGVGSLIYTNISMTTLVGNAYFQLTTEGNGFVNVFSGEVQELMPIGSSC